MEKTKIRYTFIGKIGKYATGRMAIWIPKEDVDNIPFPSAKKLKVIIEELEI